MFERYQGIFRSRWRAVFWASGVLLTAYCSVPSADEQGDEPDAKAQAAAVEALIGKAHKDESHSDESHGHVNPWAKKQPG